MPTEGEGVPREDGPGRGGDETPPIAQAVEAREASGSDEGMPRGPMTSAPPSPQQGTAADKYSVGTLHRHPDGAGNASPENGMQLCRKYGLLALEKPAGDSAAAGTQVRGYGHGATRGTDNQRATETADGTGQRVLLASGMPEDDNGERRPPE